MKNFFSLFLSFTILSFAAHAQQQDQAAVNRALSSIISGEGSITKAQYDMFWNEVGVAGDKEAKKRTIAAIRGNFLLMQEYQKEIWKCAETNWNSQKNYPCKAANRSFAKIKAEFKKSGQENAFDPVERNSIEILSAASKRSGSFKAAGTDLPLSLEFIKKTRKNMDRVFSRMDQLFKENYQ